MKTTKRNKKDLIDIDIIDLNGSSKDGRKKGAGKKAVAGKKTAAQKKTVAAKKTAGGKNASDAPARRKGNREFAVITYFFLALFICLSG